MSIRRRTRAMKPTISDALRTWLETGERPKGNIECFMLAKSADLLRPAWERCRDEIMADWKREGQKGKPWAAKQFDKTENKRRVNLCLRAEN